jgi:hypothetical protein
MGSALIAKDAGYRLLPFRYLRLEDADCANVLLTAETGEYLFFCAGRA